MDSMLKPCSHLSISKNVLQKRSPEQTFVATTQRTHPLVAWFWEPAGLVFMGSVGKQQTKKWLLIGYYPRAQGREKSPNFLLKEIYLHIFKAAAWGPCFHSAESKCWLRSFPLGKYLTHPQLIGTKLAVLTNQKGLRETKRWGQVEWKAHLLQKATPSRLGEVDVLSNA